MRDMMQTVSETVCVMSLLLLQRIFNVLRRMKLLFLHILYRKNFETQ